MKPTTTYRKKMIEVALPLEAINKESAREKSIRHGHPSTLHLWWARRPLAACRAVLFASLVDDPDSDPAFRKANGSVDEETAGEKRAELFNLIEEMVKWENSNNPTVLRKARAEIARCVASRKIELGELAKETIIHGSREGRKHPNGAVSGAGVTAWEVVIMTAREEVVDHFLATYGPPVLDPFCGGGSIPLEAQRLGLRAYASDLNPVPVLITKALIEIPPKFAGKPPVNPDSQRGLSGTSWDGAKGLAEDVRYYGKWMRDEAERRVGKLYPKVKVTAAMAKDRPDLRPYVGEELTVIAWLWARTVASPNPTCGGAHVPLVRSFWLSTKKDKEAYIEPVIDKRSNSYEFKVSVGKPKDRSLVDAGTKIGRGCKFRCLLSDMPIADSHVKAEGMADNLGARLLAIVAEGSKGRVYLSPDQAHEKIASVRRPENIQGIEAPIALDKRAIWCLLYGLDQFDKLFTSRQLVALTTFSDLVGEAREKVLADAKAAKTLPTDDRPLYEGGAGPVAYADAVVTYLGFTVSRQANRLCTICFWDQGRENVQQAFARQALPMTWDFCEANPFSESSGNWTMQLDFPVRCIEVSQTLTSGAAKQLDATAAINGCSSPLVSTDPPYYDNIGYADLSDFFYVWLRRSLGGVYPQLFATLLTPKAQELIASPYRHDGSKEKAQRFFEEGLGKAFVQMHTSGHRDYPVTVYYAFKQAEAESGDGDDSDGSTTSLASTGWETMLEGLIRAGFAVTGTWPMRTELVGNLKKEVSALASSIVLSCRPRPTDAQIATRREFIAALGRELADALRHLQRGSIAPVDLAQASIGPGMAIFTRYAKVVEADGSPMTVRTALALINQTLDEVLAEQEGEFDADTRWALGWFEQYGTEEGPYGVAETLSKAKNTSISSLADDGLLIARGGKVKLVDREHLPSDWDPSTDKRLTIWEVTQHLIRRLEEGGESEAAALLKKVGGMGEVARDLAYRLYSICERKKWSQAGQPYNALVISWPEIVKLAQGVTERPRRQEEKGLFDGR